MLLTDVQRHVDASGIAGEAREERDEEAAKKGDAEGGELDVPVRVGISRHSWVPAPTQIGGLMPLVRPHAIGR